MPEQRNNAQWESFKDKNFWKLQTGCCRLWNKATTGRKIVETLCENVKRNSA